MLYHKEGSTIQVGLFEFWEQHSIHLGTPLALSRDQISGDHQGFGASNPAIWAKWLVPSCVGNASGGFYQITN